MRKEKSSLNSHKQRMFRHPMRQRVCVHPETGCHRKKVSMSGRRSSRSRSPICAAYSSVGFRRTRPSTMIPAWERVAPQPCFVQTREIGPVVRHEDHNAVGSEEQLRRIGVAQSPLVAGCRGGVSLHAEQIGEYHRDVLVKVERGHYGALSAARRASIAFLWP